MYRHLNFIFLTLAFRNFLYFKRDCINNRYRNAVSGLLIKLCIRIYGCRLIKIFILNRLQPPSLTRRKSAYSDTTPECIHIHVIDTLFTAAYRIPCLSCVVRQNIGSPFSFIRRPFCLLFSLSGVIKALTQTQRTPELSPVRLVIPAFILALTHLEIFVMTLFLFKSIKLKFVK